MKFKQYPMRVKLADVEADPLNPNVTPRATLDKIKNNIKRTGLYPPLILRPAVKGKIEPPWISIDGWHRRLVLLELDHEEGDSVVWDVTEREAHIFLATLNQLHGADDYARRAHLMQSIVDVTPMDQLPDIMPESLAEIEDLLRVTQIDLDALERAQVETADREEAEAPRPFTVLLFGSQEAVVRQALEHIKKSEGFGPKNADGNALELLAAEYLSGAGLVAPEGDEHGA